MRENRYDVAMSMKLSTLILLLITLTSCAGYRIRKKGNPFEDMGVRSVAVPMFINKSVYPGAHTAFTKEVKTMLSTYPELSISTELDRDVDALLIGIVESPTRYSGAYKRTAEKFLSGGEGSSIGDRAGLYVPTASSFKINVTVILIKDPSLEERKMMSSDLGKLMERHPKVVFSRTFSYEGSFNREAKDTVTSDSGGVVNYTNTKRYLEQNIETIAEQSASDIEELVINVF